MTVTGGVPHGGPTPGPHHRVDALFRTPCHHRGDASGPRRGARPAHVLGGARPPRLPHGRGLPRPGRRQPVPGDQTRRPYGPRTVPRRPRHGTGRLLPELDPHRPLRPHDLGALHRPDGQVAPAGCPYDRVPLPLPYGGRRAHRPADPRRRRRRRVSLRPAGRSRRRRTRGLRLHLPDHHRARHQRLPPGQRTPLRPLPVGGRGTGGHVLDAGALQDGRRLRPGRRVGPDRQLRRLPPHARRRFSHVRRESVERRADPGVGQAHHTLARGGHRRPVDRHRVDVHRRPSPQVPCPRHLLDQAGPGPVDLARRRQGGRAEPGGAEEVRRLRGPARLAVRGRRRGLVLQARRVGRHRSRLADEQLDAGAGALRQGTRRRDPGLAPLLAPRRPRRTGEVALHAGALGRQGREDRLHGLGVPGADAPGTTRSCRPPRSTT